MSYFTIWNIQSAVTCESGRTTSSKLVCFGISKRILYFPCCFNVPATVLFIVYLRTVISMFRFFCYLWHSKAKAVNQAIQLFFIKDLPSVTQSNVQAVTAENEEQHTLSNIIYIKFQNCCFFSLRFILKDQWTNWSSDDRYEIFCKVWVLWEFTSKKNFDFFNFQVRILILSKKVGYLFWVWMNSERSSSDNCSR